jgi:F-type H+-transporting ATPase subunit beta
MSQAQGTIVQCIGAVIDIEFPRDSMPHIYDALTLADSDSKLVEKGLTFEVEQQLGDGVVRTIALGSSDGLQRGMKVLGTGAPISVPVGPAVLGRIMDVLGRPIDERGPVEADERRAIHQPAPKFDELAPSVELLETGIKVMDLICPFAKAARSAVRRRRRRQDREHARADQQHRDAALGPLGVRGRRRARARGQRLHHEMSEAKVIVQEDLGKSKVAMVFGQIGSRRAIDSASHDRSHDGGEFPRRGRDILFFIDSIYRFTLAGTRCRRCSTACRPRSVTSRRRRNGPAERITSTRPGSITSIEAVYVPADDLPIRPRRRRRAPDATVVLSRDIASPASILPLIHSTRRRAVDPNVIGEALATTRAVQAVLQRYNRARHHASWHGRYRPRTS